MNTSKDDKRGNIRRVDELGRIVIPMDIRKRLDINNLDYLEIMASDTEITIRKFENSCIFCGNRTDISQFMGKNVCAKCREELSKKN